VVFIFRRDLQIFARGFNCPVISDNHAVDWLFDRLIRMEEDSILCKPTPDCVLCAEKFIEIAATLRSWLNDEYPLFLSSRMTSGKESHAVQRMPCPSDVCRHQSLLG
jgi:hypothetical protein